MQLAALQNLSSFTLLDSPTKIVDLLKTAKEKGYQAVGLTDVNVTYGLVNFYELAKRAGIKPLLGMQVRLNGLIDSTQKYDLIVFAKNNAGYHNLLRLSSAINLLTDNGQNDKILTLTELTKYLDDLLVIVPANTHSELLNLFETNQQLGSDYIRDLKKLTSELYLGVYASNSSESYVDYVHALAKQFELPLVATEDCEYLRPRDQFLQKTLRAIRSGQKMQDTIPLAKQDGSHFLANAEEMLERYHRFNLDDAVNNTWKIAEECNAEVIFQKPVLPKYHQDKFATSEEYLHHLAQTGLQARFGKGKVPAEYQKRLNYELRVINQMGFDNYFLIVWDVINYCHRVKITTGPGRGSACGSLVSYALRITEVDPLKYHLLFERFLNPARHEMPDIDLDIPDIHRDTVIKYMYQKYGMDHAAQILTFGTLAAKQALRDVGRVFGLTMVEVNKWARAIPYSKDKMTLKRAYEESRELRLLVDATPENKLLFKTAMELEGLPRHYSIHAAGLVISDDSIAGISGLQAGPLGIPVTQQTKKYVESLGLLKIDFLGLRNLTVLGNILDLVRQQGVNIDPNKIPLNDQATLKLFQEGKTDAVFQFESGGIRQVLRKLHPDDFEDLVAVNALYRPGPMQNIDTFIARKNGQEPVKYPDPSLKQILQPTYGILVYQEQVMQTAQILAGFSLGEADILRRAMSKKKQDVIEQERSKFITGTVKKGHPKEVAERVYHYIEQFANYGFNRSHAVAYTKIAFWLAYLKVHYPAAFYTAMLNSSTAVKAQGYIMQAQEADIHILAPDINRSHLDYSLENNDILVGLKAIKGLRVDFAKEIAENKKQYKSLSDFLRRIDAKFLQVDAIEALIMAGAFDQIEDNRNELLANCKEIIANVQLTGQNISLSEILGDAPLKPAEKPTNAEKAEMEEKVLGFATTTTPLVAVQKYAKKFDARALNQFQINESGISVGKLMKYKQIRTKNGKTMAFATFADSSSQQEVIIFPGVYEKFSAALKTGDIYLLGLRTQGDRFDQKKIQYLLTNLRKVNFKE
ncbi:DNA polymerase III subunit alpha [Lactobacillus ultunensis]|uniref:DNA-directed DNA polymerase n=1 Tax=Lactobacillus ultunensis DSM 16047 TaxID=525365 RepID=C2EMV6_9LACO|nr:DNA polymerase III subunit alpha [Lactobacillus ultunensis]EEJ72125.1 DNA polymerase III, alpha subunit [Lactobacillus ultunensis DSM 16047]KRL80908.1 DNA-directed DNA polymerase [Lactobacillus ultunensis DSM 16047]QQP27759.1 DNA polymerase III subunit alpha [Lactobacillus ultunensis]